MSKKSLDSHSKKTLENALKRLKIELAEIHYNPIPEIEVYPISNDNVFEWIAKIEGPIESPYEGGIFEFRMSFPSNYPFKPPTCKFETRIYHCNVNSAGMVCLDILAVSIFSVKKSIFENW
jgi:ubiquitin-protein ligase